MNMIKAKEKSLSPSFSFDKFIDGLKLKLYKKIIVMSGAGISVASGIPDFRTPKTGLYARVKDYGLPHPEDLFNLEYFMENPRPFFEVAGKFLNFNASPTKAHLFIKKLYERKSLLMNYTQNIDGLELEVGIPPKFVFQAHGHLRSAHCCKCHFEYPIDEFFQHSLKEEIFQCKKCPKEDAEALVKPDIIFFGEKLPRNFKSKISLIGKSDLIIIMGTSLKVRPFSDLVRLIPKEVPIVIINRENPGVDRESSLFLEGDIQVTVEKILSLLSWNDSDTQPSSGPMDAKPDDNTEILNPNIKKNSKSKSKFSESSLSKTKKPKKN